MTDFFLQNKKKILSSAPGPNEMRKPSLSVILLFI